MGENMVKQTIFDPCHKKKKVVVNKFQCIDNKNVFVFND